MHYNTYITDILYEYYISIKEILEKYDFTVYKKDIILIICNNCIFDYLQQQINLLFDMI